MDGTDVGGLRICYERAGDGPPLVLLHGYVGDGPTTWRRQIDALSDEFTVVAWDAPGAGRSCECRAEDGCRLDPTRFAGLSVPTMLLAGSDSPPDLAASTAALAAALPGAQVVTMAAQGHVAMLTAPALFATQVLAFLRADRP